MLLQQRETQQRETQQWERQKGKAGGAPLTAATAEILFAGVRAM